MPHYKKHIFVCGYNREGSPETCCGPKGGEELQRVLKEKLKKYNELNFFRANKAGCLDACKFGISMVIYPNQIWYGGVKVEDLDEIIEKSILRDEVIDRLKIDFSAKETK